MLTLFIQYATITGIEKFLKHTTLENGMKNILLFLFILGFLCTFGCSSKEDAYRNVYEGLKMGKDLQEERDDPSGDRRITDDEKLPEYDQYKNRRKEILKKDK